MTALFMTTVLFAPAPSAAPPAKDAPAAEIGLPPRFLELKPNADGKIMVQAIREHRPAPAPGAKRGLVVTGWTTVENVELANVKDLKITTAAGKEVTTEDAVKSLSNGGIVVVSADGQTVSPAYLKMLKGDVLVFVSSDLVAPGGPPRAQAPAPARGK